MCKIQYNKTVNINVNKFKLYLITNKYWTYNMYYTDQIFRLIYNVFNKKETK